MAVAAGLHLLQSTFTWEWGQEGFLSQPQCLPDFALYEICSTEGGYDRCHLCPILWKPSGGSWGKAVEWARTLFKSGPPRDLNWHAGPYSPFKNLSKFHLFFSYLLLWSPPLPPILMISSSYTRPKVEQFVCPIASPRSLSFFGFQCNLVASK